MNALRWVKGLSVIPLKGLLDGVQEFNVILVVSFKRMSLLSYTFSKSQVSSRKSSLLGHINSKRICMYYQLKFVNSQLIKGMDTNGSGS